MVLRLQKPESSEVLLECSTRQTPSSAGASTLQLASISNPCAPAVSRCGPLQSGSFFHAFDLIAEGDPQTIEPAFVDVLLEGFWSFLRTLSCRRCLGMVSSSCSHPTSSQHPRQAMWLLSCSPKTRFLSFSCLFLSTYRLIERRQISSVSPSFILRFCSGFP